MQAHGWRGFITYQPASRYWPFQGIETGIYLLLAAALSGHVRRRPPEGRVARRGPGAEDRGLEGP